MRSAVRRHGLRDLLIAGVIIGVSVSQIIVSFAIIPSAGDTEAYWQAAMRLRHGDMLYAPPTADLLATDIYRYAPWFAWLWVPLTYLPKDVVDVVWRAVMVAATGVALVPLLRVPTLASLAAASLLGWLTVQTALYGNVQPLLIAGLAWTVDRRAGPVWIAIGASMKFVPFLYVLVYVGRRDWRKAAWTTGLSILLLAPMLLYDLSSYTTTPGMTPSLFAVHPLLWAVVVAGAVVVTMALSARGHHARWLAASCTVLVAYPQLFLSYASHLLIGADPSRTR